MAMNARCTKGVSTAAFMRYMGGVEQNRLQTTESRLPQGSVFHMCAAKLGDPVFSKAMDEIALLQVYHCPIAQRIIHSSNQSDRKISLNRSDITRLESFSLYVYLKMFGSARVVIAIHDRQRVQHGEREKQDGHEEETNDCTQLHGPTDTLDERPTHHQ